LGRSPAPLAVFGLVIALVPAESASSGVGRYRQFLNMDSRLSGRHLPHGISRPTRKFRGDDEFSNIPIQHQATGFTRRLRKSPTAALRKQVLTVNPSFFPPGNGAGQHQGLRPRGSGRCTPRQEGGQLDSSHRTSAPKLGAPCGENKYETFTYRASPPSRMHTACRGRARGGRPVFSATTSAPTTPFHTGVAPPRQRRNGPVNAQNHLGADSGG